MDSELIEECVNISKLFINSAFGGKCYRAMRALTLRKFDFVVDKEHTPNSNELAYTHLTWSKKKQKYRGNIQVFMGCFKLTKPNDVRRFKAVLLHEMLHFIIYYNYLEDWEDDNTHRGRWKELASKLQAWLRLQKRLDRFFPKLTIGANLKGVVPKH